MSTLRDVTTAAGPLGMHISVHDASSIREINSVFVESCAVEPPDAVFVAGDGLFSNRRVQLVQSCVPSWPSRDDIRNASSPTSAGS